jgi:hypothetical protein
VIILPNNPPVAEGTVVVNGNSIAVNSPNCFRGQAGRHKGLRLHQN